MLLEAREETSASSAAMQAAAGGRDRLAKDLVLHVAGSEHPGHAVAVPLGAAIT